MQNKKTTFATFFCTVFLLQVFVPFAAFSQVRPGSQANRSPITPATSSNSSLSTKALSFDLSSQKPSLTASNTSAVNIIVGGTNRAGTIHSGSYMNIMPGTLVTPAQYTAVLEVLQGKQTISLGSNGAAIGGFHTFKSNDVSKFDSITVPKNVALNVLGYNAKTPLNVMGALNIAGSVFALQSAPNIVSVINSGTLNLLPGAILSGQLPSNQIMSGAFSSAGLSINVANTLSNQGTISSPGTLAITAGSIINQQAAGGPAALMSAQNIKLFSSSGSFVNSGLIESLAAVNFNTKTGTDLSINNTAGIIRALGANGLEAAININTLNSDYESGNTSVFGGVLAAAGAEINGYGKNINFNLDRAEGSINTKGSTAHVTVKEGTLNLGSQILSGDPSYFNNAGDITISSMTGINGDLAIAASGNVDFLSHTTISTTANKNIFISAGLNFTTSGQNSGKNDSATVLTFDGTSNAGKNINSTAKQLKIQTSGSGTISLLATGAIGMGKSSSIETDSGDILAIESTGFAGAGTIQSQSGNISINSAATPTLNGMTIIDGSLSGTLPQAGAASTGAITTPTIKSGAGTVTISSAGSVQVSNGITSAGSVGVASSQEIKLSGNINADSLFIQGDNGAKIQLAGKVTTKTQAIFGGPTTSTILQTSTSALVSSPQIEFGASGDIGSTGSPLQISKIASNSDPIILSVPASNKAFIKANTSIQISPVGVFAYEKLEISTSGGIDGDYSMPIRSQQITLNAGKSGIGSAIPLSISEPSLAATNLKINSVGPVTIYSLSAVNLVASKSTDAAISSASDVSILLMSGDAKVMNPIKSNSFFLSTRGAGSVYVNSNISSRVSVDLRTGAAAEISLDKSASIKTTASASIINLISDNLLLGGKLLPAANSGIGLAPADRNLTVRIGGDSGQAGEFFVSTAMLQSLKSVAVGIGSVRSDAPVILSDNLNISGKAEAGTSLAGKFNLSIFTSANFSSSGKTLVLGGQSLYVRTGSLDLGPVKAGTGRIDITTQNDISINGPLSTSSSGSVILATKAGSVDIGSNPIGGGAASSITAFGGSIKGSGTVTGTAVSLLCPQGGTIGDAANPLSVQAKTLNLTGDDAFINSKSSLILNESFLSSNLLIQSAGSITVAAKVSAGSSISLQAGANGSIYLNAALLCPQQIILAASGSGSIVQGSGQKALQTDSLTLVTAAGSIGSASKAVLIDVSFLAANSSAGIVNLANAKALTLNSSSAKSFTLSSAAADQSGNSIMVNGSITASNSLTLRAPGKLITNPSVADLTAPVVSIRSTNGAIEFNSNVMASTSLTIQAKSDISTAGVGSLSSPNMTLTSDTGNVGSPSSWLNINAGKLTLSAKGSNQNAYLSEQDTFTFSNSPFVGGSLNFMSPGTIILSKSITAREIGVWSGAGVTIDVALTGTDWIGINAQDFIKLNANLSSSGGILLSGNKGITQTSGTLSANHLTLSAIDGSVGASSAKSRIVINARELHVDAFATSSDVYVNSLGGLESVEGYVQGTFEVNAKGSIGSTGYGINATNLGLTTSVGDINLTGNIAFEQSYINSAGSINIGTDKAAASVFAYDVNFTTNGKGQFLVNQGSNITTGERGSILVNLNGSGGFQLKGSMVSKSDGVVIDFGSKSITMGNNNVGIPDGAFQLGNYTLSKISASELDIVTTGDITSSGDLYLSGGSIALMSLSATNFNNTSTWSLSQTSMAVYTSKNITAGSIYSDGNFPYFPAIQLMAGESINADGLISASGGDIYLRGANITVGVSGHIDQVGLGDIYLKSDKLSFSGAIYNPAGSTYLSASLLNTDPQASIYAGSGTVILSSDAYTMYVGGSIGSAQFQVSNTLLNNITAGTVSIINTHYGSITVDGNVNTTSKFDLNFATEGNFYMAAGSKLTAGTDSKVTISAANYPSPVLPPLPPPTAPTPTGSSIHSLTLNINSELTPHPDLNGTPGQYTFTIFVEEGKYYLPGNGHVFVSISDGTTKYTQGFYSLNKSTKAICALAGGQIKDDTDTFWDVKKSWPISADQFAAGMEAMGAWVSKGSPWSPTRHCGNFAEYVGKAVGLQFNDNELYSATVPAWVSAIFPDVNGTVSNRPNVFATYLRSINGQDNPDRLPFGFGSKTALLDALLGQTHLPSLSYKQSALGNAGINARLLPGHLPNAGYSFSNYSMLGAPISTGGGSTGGGSTGGGSTGGGSTGGGSTGGGSTGGSGIDTYHVTGYRQPDGLRMIDHRYSFISNTASSGHVISLILYKDSTFDETAGGVAIPFPAQQLPDWGKNLSNTSNITRWEYYITVDSSVQFVDYTVSEINRINNGPLFMGPLSTSVTGDPTNFPGNPHIAFAEVFTLNGAVPQLHIDDVRLFNSTTVAMAMGIESAGGMPSPISNAVLSSVHLNSQTMNALNSPANSFRVSSQVMNTLVNSQIVKSQVLAPQLPGTEAMSSQNVNLPLAKASFTPSISTTNYDSTRISQFVSQTKQPVFGNSQIADSAIKNSGKQASFASSDEVAIIDAEQVNKMLLDEASNDKEENSNEVFLPIALEATSKAVANNSDLAARGGQLTLSKGAVLISPNRDIRLQTKLGTIHIAANSIVLIAVAGEDSISVFNFHDVKRHSVRVQVNDNTLDLEPGRHLTLSQVQDCLFADINPFQSVAYRNLNSSKIGQIQLHCGEFSIVTALGGVNGLKKLNSTNPSLQKTILKDAAAISQFTAGAKGPYRLLERSSFSVQSRS